MTHLFSSDDPSAARRTATAPEVPTDALGVHLRAARLVFAGVPLFDDLALDLAPGRVTALLGPSGVGKSTLLRLLAGLESGAHVSASVTCTDGRPLAGRVAYLGQRDALLPWAGVLDNAILGARLRGTPRAPARDRARALLFDVGLGGQDVVRPAALSGGMRQRVALVRALMEDRPVVLMDEPFSALDMLTRLRLQDLTARLLAGRTVLLVTHDPLEALRLGHVVHVLHGRPATLDAALTPPDSPPRDAANPALLALQGELLHRLTGAAHGAQADRATAEDRS